MLTVKKRSEKTQLGDLIAFLNGDQFIGYGKVVGIFGDNLIIDEDPQVHDELDALSRADYEWSIEVD